MDCIICLDATDKKSRAPSQCSFCANVVCRSCIQTYLLMDDATDPVCPNTECKKAWSQTFLCDTLTASFRLGPFKAHREKVLFDREKARLPDSQDDAKRYKDALATYEPLRVEISRTQERLRALPESVAANELERRYNDAVAAAIAEERAKPKVDGESPYFIAYRRTNELRMEFCKARKAQKSAVAPLKEQVATLNAQIGPVQYAATHFGEEPPWAADVAAAVAAAAAAAPAAPLAGAGGPAPVPVPVPVPVAAPVKERKKFVMKCPKGDCEGFLSQHYKCGMCDVHVCSRCHIVKTAEHLCDPDLVETIKQIRSEAKPCPKCASLISKIDGCDQIWCTQCHTAFSWNTGLVETGVVHNPHYYQYLRETGQVIARADNPGFGCAAVNMLDRTLTRLSTTVPSARPLIELYRQLSHVREVDLMRRRRTLTAYQEQEWRRVLRVQRLVGEIDQPKWMDLLQRQEKAFNKDTAWVQLLEMYTTVSLETLATITRDSDAAAVDAVIARIATIKDYTMTEANKISKIYGCVIPEGIRPPKTPAASAAAASATAAIPE